MSWFPLSYTVPQYVDPNGVPYSGAVLKAYEAGTSTPTNMATDYTGGTTAASFALNASGFPVNGSAVIIPHIDRDFKLALYPTQTAADANSGAIWTVDNIKSIGATFGDLVVTGSESIAGALVVSGASFLYGGATVPVENSDDNSSFAASTSFVAGHAPITGVSSNSDLGIKVTGNTTATIAFSEVTLKTALGGQSVTVSGGSHTLDISTTGAGGLDTGSPANNTFYYVYEIYDPATQTKNVLATATPGSRRTEGVYNGANMPAGYTQSGLIGILLTNGSAHFLQSTQIGREVFYQTGIACVTNLTPLVASLTTKSIAAAVPPMASSASGFLSVNTYSGVASLALSVAADATGLGLQNTTSGIPTSSGIVIRCPFRHLPMDTAQTMFVAYTDTQTGTTNSLTIDSFTF